MLIPPPTPSECGWVVLWFGLLGSRAMTTASAQRAGEIVHPAAAYMVRPLKPSGTLSTVDTGNGDSSLRAVISQLRAATPTLTVGALDSPDQQVFGAIKDVQLGTDGRVFVLDSRLNEVRVFSARGEFVQSFGRPGRGPGEFVNPQSLAVTADGRVYVGDVTRQVHAFTMNRDGEYRYASSFRTSVGPADMCFLGDRLYVHGSEQGLNEVIHEYAQDGTSRGSFATPYVSPNPSVNTTVSRGHIACVPGDSLLLYAPASLLAEVRAYSPEGKLRWLVTIAPYKPIDYTEMANGGLRVAIPSGGFNRVEALSAIRPGYCVLQIALVTEPGAGFARLRTLVVSAASGRGAFVSDSLSGAVMAAGVREFVAVRQDPYPQFVVYTY